MILVIQLLAVIVSLYATARLGCDVLAEPLLARRIRYDPWWIRVGIRLVAVVVILLVLVVLLSYRVQPFTKLN